MDVLTPEIRAVLSGVFVVLVVSTVVAEVVARGRPSKSADVARRRIHSWWLLASTFTLAIVVTRNVSLIFFAFISFLALKEYFTLIPTRRVDRGLLFWAYLAIPAQYLWVGMHWFTMFIVFVPVYMFIFLPIGLVLTGRPSGFIRIAGMLHWGLMITVFSLSHLAYLLVLPEGPDARVTGAGLLIYLVLLTELNNVFQYLWGRILRWHPIAPRIHPAWTWWGLGAGIATTAIASLLIAPTLTPLGHWGALFAGLIIGAGGFIGNMTIAALKRDLRVRETGSYIPGHGGVIDRVDSLAFTAPAFFHFIRFFHNL